ncbi:AAA family ATPase (plasmid) [Nocardia sp. NBC_01377]|uniref:AAA family ATPase n=1 Tax=Nocardia sp. NBC_01377 TaxID=2903595 RepID=UPI002F90C72D
MIIWLNGPYGVGKSTSADALADFDATWHRFEPEKVGFLVLSQLQDFGYDDFQHLPAWRTLTPMVADVIAREASQHLVIAQTVLVRQYWHEIAEGFRILGHPVLHVLLEASPDTVRRRICGDDLLHRAAGWRLEHMPSYIEARREWMAAEAELIVDTSDLSPRRVAEKVAAAARDRLVQARR